MSKNEIEQSLLSGLGDLFGFESKGDFCSVSTPFHYPDGGAVGVFCKPEGDTVLVTDEGETAGWLWLISGRHLTPKQQKMIEEVCGGLCVEYENGVIQCRCGPGGSLADVIIRVAQAIIRVADISYTFHSRDYESPSDEVADYLGENGLSFARSEKHTGCSEEK